MIVPKVGATGRGRSVYYVWEQLIELRLMSYLIGVHLSFNAARSVLEIYQKRKITENFWVLLNYDRAVFISSVKEIPELPSCGGIVNVPLVELLQEINARNCQSHLLDK